MSNPQGTKADRMAEFVKEMEQSKTANSPEFQGHELDTMITFYEGKLRNTPKDGIHAEERAQLEVMVDTYRRMLRGEEK